MIATCEGKLAVAFTFQASGATRALELLGKHVGLFGNRPLEVSVGEPLLAEYTEDQWIE